MADLTGSVQSNAISVSSGTRFLKLAITQTRLPSTNKSRIDWTLTGEGTASGYVLSGPITAVIDGKTVYTTSSRIELRQGTVVSSGSTEVSHNSDGNKQITISISAAIYQKAVNSTGSKSFNLVSNVLDSTLSAPESVEIGKYCDIRINRSASATFVTVKYELYKDASLKEILTSGKIIQNSMVATTSWLIPTSFYEKLWNTTEGYLRLSCEGFNSSNTKVGNTTYTGVKITMNIDAIRPKITECWAKNADPTTIPIVGENGVVSGVGQISAKCSAEAFESAQISTIRLNDGWYIYTMTNGQHSLIPTSPNGLLTFSVIDSRGLVATATVTLTVHDYTKPTISLSESRLELNPEDRTKGQIVLSASGLGFNGTIGSITNEFTIEVTAVNEDSSATQTFIINPESLVWTNGGPTTHRYTVQGTILDVDDPNATYTVRAIIKDSITTSGVQAEEVILNRTPAFDYGRDSFNFNVPIHYKNESLHDRWKLSQFYMDGRGTHNWTGNTTLGNFAEVWGKLETSVSVGTQLGSMYYNHTMITGSLPFNFVIDDPLSPYTILAQMEVMDKTSGKMIMTTNAYIEDDLDSSTGSQKFCVGGISPTKLTNESCKVYVYIAGFKHEDQPDNVVMPL